jgi:hypothetical protein
MRPSITLSFLCRLPNNVGIKKDLTANPGTVDARSRTNHLQRDICVQRPLDAVFKNVVQSPRKNDSTDFAFFGSVSGVTRIFPFIVSSIRTSSAAKKDKHPSI